MTNDTWDSQCHVLITFSISFLLLQNVEIKVRLYIWYISSAATTSKANLT